MPSTHSPRNLGVRALERIIVSLRLAPLQLSAKGIDRSLNDMGRDLLTLSKKEQEVNDLPGWHGEKPWRFFPYALPGVR